MNKFAKEPISNIEWRDSATLLENSWNPNMVFNQELKLLERNILVLGYVQPVLINPDGLIIDGFHRTMLARDSKLLRKKYSGMVPCTVVKVDKAQAMILTIRMNRAKGSHAAVKMSEIVRELIDVHHYDPQEVAIEIGATADEVELLRQDGVFKNKDTASHVYSRAWYPRETGKAPA